MTTKFGSFDASRMGAFKASQFKDARNVVGVVPPPPRHYTRFYLNFVANGYSYHYRSLNLETITAVQAANWAGDLQLFQSRLLADAGHPNHAVIWSHVNDYYNVNYPQEDVYPRSGTKGAYFGIPDPPGRTFNTFIRSDAERLITYSGPYPVTYAYPYVSASSWVAAALALLSGITADFLYAMGPSGEPSPGFFFNWESEVYSPIRAVHPELMHEREGGGFQPTDRWLKYLTSW